MKIKVAIISSAIIGMVFGVLSNYSILLGSWLNLIVWAIIGILIGLFIEDKNCIKSSGISYGFLVTLSFLISGFQGSSAKIFNFVLLSMALSLIGAFCGFYLVNAGYWFKRKRA